MCAGVRLQVGIKANTTGDVMEIFDLMGLVVICALSYFTLCRLFDVDKLTIDQLERYNKELEHQRWVLECNAVPSNHNYEHMAEQAVIKGKTQDDNPFPYGTRDYDRWLCSYMEFEAKKQFKQYSDYQLGTKAHAVGGGLLDKGRKRLEVGNKRVRISHTWRGRN